jgi:hypothetical protein
VAAVDGSHLNPYVAGGADRSNPLRNAMMVSNREPQLMTESESIRVLNLHVRFPRDLRAGDQ